MPIEIRELQIRIQVEGDNGSAQSSQQQLQVLLEQCLEQIAAAEKDKHER